MAGCGGGRCWERMCRLRGAGEKVQGWGLVSLMPLTVVGHLCRGRSEAAARWLSWGDACE